MDPRWALIRFYGTGFSLMGRSDDPDLLPMFFSLYTTTLLWIPLWPRRIIIVSGGDPLEIGSISLVRGWIARKDFERIYPGQSTRLLASAFGHIVYVLAAIVVAGLIFLGAVRLLG